MWSREVEAQGLVLLPITLTLTNYLGLTILTLYALSPFSL